MRNIISSCPHCGSENTKLREKLNFEGYDFLVPDMKKKSREWIDCLSCGVCFSTPRLSEKQLEYMYDNYRSEEFRGESPDEYFDRIVNYPPEESENHQKILWIKEKLEDQFVAEKILDIGCGGGVLLFTLRKYFESAKLFGIEPTSNFAELSRRRTNSIIINGYFDEKSFIKEKFSLITCCQVLEHVDELDKFVKNVRDKLENGGFLYIEVPDVSDFDYLPKDHSRFLEPSHLWYFNKNFLCEKLFKNNFQVVDKIIKKTIRGRNNLMIIFKKF